MVQVMVAVVVAVLEAIELMTGGVLSTVTLIDEEVAKLPEASRATATIDLEPLDVAVVSHATEYGAEVSSDPIIVPFTLNVTPATPILSEALAEIVTDGPKTIVPAVGTVSETFGAVVSGIGAGVASAEGFPAPNPGLYPLPGHHVWRQTGVGAEVAGGDTCDVEEMPDPTLNSARVRGPK